MPDTGPTIRTASQQEVMIDVLMNPLDLWLTHPLGMPPGRVVRAAATLWGRPSPGGAEGELLWRLRVDGELPAYVSVGMGEPCVLLSSTQTPDSPGALVGVIRDMLSGAADG